MSTRRNDYLDFTPSTPYKEYQISTLENGNSSIQDVTDYIQEGDKFTAALLNDLSQNAYWNVTMEIGTEPDTSIILSGGPTVLEGIFPVVFKATASYSGQTFKITSEETTLSLTVKLPNGGDIPENLFSANAVVSAMIDCEAQTITFPGSSGSGGGGSSYYGVSDTTAGTAEKSVSIEKFKLNIGTTAYIKFNSINTATSPTLNISGTGAKPIVQYGTTAISPSAIHAGRISCFIYDGTSWNIDTGSETMAQLITVSSKLDAFIANSAVNVPQYMYVATIATSKWTSSSGKYVATITGITQATVSGVGVISPSPNPASYDQWVDNSVRALALTTDGQLKLQADSKPTASMTVVIEVKKYGSATNV